MERDTRAATRPATPPLWHAAVVLGFAAAVTMWTLGFLLRLPAVQAKPLLIAEIFGFVQLTFGALAGAALGRGRGLRAAALAGLVSGVVNLLLIGSIVSSEAERNTLKAEWPVFLGLSLIGLPLMSVLGAGAGAAMRAKAGARKPSEASSGGSGAHEPEENINWPGWMAAVAAAGSLVLLIVGGLVTSLEAGLAVPDWPNSYGYNMFLFPLSQMHGGAYFEHTHRLFGTLVGLAMIAMVALAIAADKRRLARGLSLIALALVILQGVLGGLRVTGKPTMSQTEVEPNLAFALLHGMLGQAFFAFLCVVACVMSARWKRADAPMRATPPGAGRSLSVALLVVLFAQLALGAMARHFDQSSGYLHIVATHGVNAVVVAAFASMAGARAARALPGEVALRRVGKGLLHGVGLQILLGGATLWVVWANRGKAAPPALEVVLATAHQTLGALLLGGAAALFAWTRRVVAPASA